MTTFAQVATGANLVSTEENAFRVSVAGAIDALDAKTAADIAIRPTAGFVATEINGALVELASAITASAGLTAGAAGVTSKSWTINRGFAGSPVDNGSFEMERGTSTNAILRWNEATDKWQVNEGGGYTNLLRTLHDKIYNASDFNPCKIAGLSATSVTWVPTNDATYFFPVVRVTSAAAALNYYAFGILIKIDAEFFQWSSSTALCIYYRTKKNDATANHIDVYVRHKSGILAAGTSCSGATKTSNVSAASDTWTTVSITRANLVAGGITWAAGDYLHVLIKAEVLTGWYTCLGPMFLKMLRV